MKKLIAGLLVLASVQAFAQKSMVKLEGMHTGNVQDKSLDFSTYSDDQDDAVKVQNIALNYAYAVTSAIQIGVTYKNYSQTKDGDAATGGKQNTLGFSFYYNFDGSLVDTNFVALHYNMANTPDGDGKANKDTGSKNTTTSIEYGHRFALGKLWGSTWTYAPSVSYSMNKMVSNNDDVDDINSTMLSWKFVAFDVFF